MNNILHLEKITHTMLYYFLKILHVYLYRIFIAAYAIFVILFIVFYFQEHWAIGVEWWLVLHSAILQVCAYVSYYAIEHEIPHRIPSESTGEAVSHHTKLFWYLLWGSMLLNIVSTVIVAPPWFLKSILGLKESEMVTTWPFWLLIFFAVCVIVFDWKLWVHIKRNDPEDHADHTPSIDPQDPYPDTLKFLYEQSI